MTPRPTKRATKARNSRAGRSCVRADLASLAARLAEPEAPQGGPAATLAHPTPLLPLDGPRPTTLHAWDTGLSGVERRGNREREARRKLVTLAYYQATFAIAS